MLEVYKPHTNREAVGVWLCSAAKRPSKRSALVNYLKAKMKLLGHINKLLVYHPRPSQFLSAVRTIYIIFIHQS